MPDTTEQGGPSDGVKGPGGPGAASEPGSHGPGGDEVAELVWRIGEDVEGAVRYVVNGREYMAGSGAPDRTVELTEAELRAEVARLDEDRDGSR